MKMMVSVVCLAIAFMIGYNYALLKHYPGKPDIQASAALSKKPGGGSLYINSIDGAFADLAKVTGISKVAGKITSYDMKQVKKKYLAARKKLEEVVVKDKKTEAMLQEAKKKLDELWVSISKD